MTSLNLAETHSKAFEALVQQPQDIVGLLAYAEYKASIRERVGAGQDVPRHLRNLAAAEIRAWRGMAERVLEQYATAVIADAKPDLIATAQKMAKDDIIAEVRKRTGIVAAVGSGIVVWVVTILLTVVAVFAAPAWVRGLIEHATRPT